MLTDMLIKDMIYLLNLVLITDAYCISVSRRSTLKCKLTKNGEDISSHTASNTYKTLGRNFRYRLQNIQSISISEY